LQADAIDIAGDKKRNIKSVPILIGRKKSIYISFLLFVIFILLSFLPVILGLFGISYFVIISLTDIMILYWAIELIKSPTIKNGRIYIRRLYLSAISGILFIIIVLIII
jgi:geranylgeranylglycerol-phosphate geranylgeranyltransferase